MTSVLLRLSGKKEWFTKIDEEDLEEASRFKWHIIKGSTTNYAARHAKRLDGTFGNQRLHNWLTDLARVDHINHDGLDNRRSNLREVTQSQNLMNSRLQRGGTSQYKGVSWHSARQKWIVFIMTDGVSNYLGYYTDETKAAQVYDAAAKDLFGEYAFLNFP